ncbi:MAG: SAM-dependent methyltransferase, partial [Anaerolineales bacterium]
ATIRRRIRAGLRQLAAEPESRQGALIAALRAKPIAVQADRANEQHYELPPAFFQTVLGPYLKYSACLWPPGVDHLAEAEAAMLRLTCERADLHDGQTILELGCGWGSLSLWMAEHYPNAQITAVSNAHNQRKFIQAQAEARGLTNLTVLTANVAELSLDRSFERVVSVEMFEHMKNYDALLGKIAGWLRPGGLLFVHHFSHMGRAYEFDDTDPQNWMARYFFAGGTMPCHTLLDHFQRDDLRVEQRWAVSGTHYEKTLNAWLAKMDAARARLRPLFAETYGAQARRWWAYWRLFFMACAESFGLDDGETYIVTHVTLRKPSA